LFVAFVFLFSFPFLYKTWPSPGPTPAFADLHFLHSLSLPRRPLPPPVSCRRGVRVESYCFSHPSPLYNTNCFWMHHSPPPPPPPFFVFSPAIQDSFLWKEWRYSFRIQDAVVPSPSFPPLLFVFFSRPRNSLQDL